MFEQKAMKKHFSKAYDETVSRKPVCATVQSNASVSYTIYILLLKYTLFCYCNMMKKLLMFTICTLYTVQYVNMYTAQYVNMYIIIITIIGQFIERRNIAEVITKTLICTVCWHVNLYSLLICTVQYAQIYIILTFPVCWYLLYIDMYSKLSLCSG